MNPEKVLNHLLEFLNADDTHPEVIRFIEDFSILIEFGTFDGEEVEEDDETS